LFSSLPKQDKNKNLTHSHKKGARWKGPPVDVLSHVRCFPSQDKNGLSLVCAVRVRERDKNYHGNQKFDILDWRTRSLGTRNRQLSKHLLIYQDATKKEKEQRKKREEKKSKE
jgi:hypothetical protein